MCTGHHADQIEYEFGDGRSLDVKIRYSKESQPLGQRYLQAAEDFLVINGDSFLQIDFRELIRSHRERGGLVNMALVRVPNVQRYGTVHVDADSRITGFAERPGLMPLGS